MHRFIGPAGQPEKKRLDTAFALQSCCGRRKKSDDKNSVVPTVLPFLSPLLFSMSRLGRDILIASTVLLHNPPGLPTRQKLPVAFIFPVPNHGSTPLLFLSRLFDSRSSSLSFSCASFCPSLSPTLKDWLVAPNITSPSSSPLLLRNHTQFLVSCYPRPNIIHLLLPPPDR